MYTHMYMILGTCNMSLQPASDVEHANRNVQQPSTLELKPKASNPKERTLNPLNPKP